MSSEPLVGVAQTAAALASPQRLRALNMLFQAPKSIEDLAACIGESHANTAAHMKTLRAAGLVNAERQGKYVLQHAVLPEALQVFLALRAAAEQHNPQVQLAMHELVRIASPVQPEEIGALIARRKVVLVDLRPEEEFRNGHIPGARSLPLDEVSSRAASVPRKRRVLAYCRGKYCPSAGSGVDALRDAGIDAERLAFGMPEWMARGLPVAVEASP